MKYVNFNSEVAALQKADTNPSVFVDGKEVMAVSFDTENNRVELLTKIKEDKSLVTYEEANENYAVTQTNAFTNFDADNRTDENKANSPAWVKDLPRPLQQTNADKDLIAGERNISGDSDKGNPALVNTDATNPPVKKDEQAHKTSEAGTNPPTDLANRVIRNRAFETEGDTKASESGSKTIRDSTVDAKKAAAPTTKNKASTPITSPKLDKKK